MSDSSAGLFGGIAFLVQIALIVVFLIAYWKIFEKAGKPGWAALIPFYNVYLMCDIVWPNKAFVPFLLLSFVPIANVIYAIIFIFRLAKAFGKDMAFGFGLLLLAPIFILILAFGDSTYQPEALA